MNLKLLIINNPGVGIRVLSRLHGIPYRELFTAYYQMMPAGNPLGRDKPINKSYQRWLDRRTSRARNVKRPDTIKHHPEYDKYRYYRYELGMSDADARGVINA